MTRLLYKPIGMLFGVLGGVLAGVIFKRIWGLLSDEEEPPDGTRADRSWAEVLFAAALEGAIYALVKASLQRSGAVAIERVSGSWPGESTGK